MKRVLYIRRKGFNYYTDYTELYLHKAFENYGFSLIRDTEKSSFSVTAYIDENEKYMAFLSPYFDNLKEDEILNFCEKFSEEFKSEAIISFCADDTVFSGEKEVFMFSDKFSAFEEPVYLTDSPPKLRWKTADIIFKTNEPYIIRLVNVGGKLSGLRILLDFDEEISDLELTGSEIIYYENKKEIRRTLNFIKTDNSFCADVDFFHLEEGLNKKCAVLRAKKLYTEEERHGFCLRLTPKSSVNSVYTPVLKIYSGHVEIFNQKLNFEI